MSNIRIGIKMTKQAAGVQRRENSQLRQREIVNRRELADKLAKSLSDQGKRDEFEPNFDHDEADGHLDHAHHEQDWSKVDMVAWVLLITLVVQCFIEGLLSVSTEK